MSAIETDRLVIRPPREDDRQRFVELFTDKEFTVFSDGDHDVESANRRFDEMLILAELVPYAKQPVIEKTNGVIVGYTGVGSIIFEGANRLEWGWRFVLEARGRGYATEATMALLKLADASDHGEMLCLMSAANGPSRRVADKVGFTWWRSIDWDDDPHEPVDLLLRPVGDGGPPLLVPVASPGS